MPYVNVRIIEDNVTVEQKLRVIERITQVLEGENAILKYREVMGATNPEKAAPGTIRKEFALNMGENSVHGSDAPETAAQEIKFFFSDVEIVG